MKKTKKAVIYGAGNIGRGFIGQLLSKSGYNIIFIDIDSELINKLNTDHCYPVRVVTEGEYEEETVRNVRGVLADNEKKAVKEIADADLMATAVGVKALPYIVKTLVKGFSKRWDNGNYQPLNIIICENLIDADQYLEDLIKEELTTEQLPHFQETVGLVKASIGRMVPNMTAEMKDGNPLRVWVEPYNKLPVDEKGFKGDLPEIKNMIPYTPFSFYIQRKLFMHNMAHAVTAYLGNLKGYTYIWEAIKDCEIKYIVMKALQEAALSLSNKHEVSIKKLLNYGDNLIYRFSNKLLGDTISRVGRDPARKLSEKDRLVGAAKLCLNQEVDPKYITVSIAAGYLFTFKEDNSAVEIQKQIKEKGIKETIKHYSEINNPEFLEKIIKIYRLLKTKNNFEDILQEIEK